MAHQPPPSPPPPSEPERPVLVPHSTQPSPSVSPPKKFPPIPWTHLETVRLIESYQEKWYSLKRGQLKANQWEEVSVSVAARCGYDEPTKTATQCRHKMEKLRKRYRSEKQQRCSSTQSNRSAWPYFDLMDLMDRGPFPISARPIALMGSSHSHPHPHPPRVIVAAGAYSIDDDEDDDDDDDDDNDGDGVGLNNKSRSINHIIRRRPVVSIAKNSVAVAVPPPPPRQWNSSGGGGGGGGSVPSWFLRDSVVRKRGRAVEDEEEEEEEGGGGGGDGGEEVLSELASVVRAFGEGFVRMENMKLEMMKETERYRMEMEAKRTEMIIQSQSRILEMIAKTIGSQQRKVKKTQET